MIYRLVSFDNNLPFHLSQQTYKLISRVSHGCFIYPPNGKENKFSSCSCMCVNWNVCVVVANMVFPLTGSLAVEQREGAEGRSAPRERQRDRAGHPKIGGGNQSGQRGVRESVWQPVCFHFLFVSKEKTGCHSLIRPHLYISDIIYSPSCQ